MEAKKAHVLSIAGKLRKEGLTPDPPFAKKQTMLRLVVDKITLSVDENWFDLDGRVPRHFLIEEPPIVGSPVGTDSLRRRA